MGLVGRYNSFGLSEAPDSSWEAGSICVLCKIVRISDPPTRSMRMILGYDSAIRRICFICFIWNGGLQIVHTSIFLC